MIMAIFIIALITIVMISFSSQMGNQLKSTMKLNESIQVKYDLESEIENKLTEFIRSIEVEYKDSTKYEVTYSNVENVVISNNREDGMNPVTINSSDAISGIEFNLIFNQEENKSTQIVLKIYNLKGSKDNENYDIGYEVKSWRS